MTKGSRPEGPPNKKEAEDKDNVSQDLGGTEEEAATPSNEPTDNVSQDLGGTEEEAAILSNEPTDNVSQDLGGIEEEAAILSNEPTEREKAHTKQIEAITQLINEDKELVSSKRNLGIGVSLFAIFIHLLILCGAYRIVFCECRTDPVTIVAISVAVLSFVAIYGIIINGALKSHSQNNVDRYNTSANGALEIAQRFSSNQ